MDLSHQLEFQSYFQGKEMGKQSIPEGEDVKKSKNSKNEMMTSCSSAPRDPAVSYETRPLYLNTPG